jgi:hypothetical protein
MILQLQYLILIAGIWNTANGILHDIFVLLQRRPFDKELIHLLIDGNILIFSGIILLLCVNGIKAQQPLAYLVSIATTLSILIYCGLIFKILPSYGTILIHAFSLFWLILDFQKLPSAH